MKKLTWSERMALSEADRSAYDKREEEAETAKALEAWNSTYKKRKPDEKYLDKEIQDYTFMDETVERAGVVLEKRTEFRFFKDGRVIMRKLASKSQRFLVVNGPKAGKRITDNDEDYVLFNRNGRYGKDVPKCVLVHRSSLKS